MSADQVDLAPALQDVRKAYRLLWDYQKRVFDIVSVIADAFEDLDFYYWRSLHADRPCNSGTDPLGRWTWDMLPMVRASYLYLRSGVDPNLTQPGQWMLEVHVDSDTGFKDPEDGSEPDPVDFAPPAESKTELRLYFWYCTGPTQLNWYRHVWDQLSWPEADGQPVDHAEPPFRIVGQTLNMAGLPDKDAVREAALAFKAMAAKALGVDLV